MKNHLLNALALACALVTVLIDRVIQPFALLLLVYIEEAFAPTSSQPQLALVPAEPTPVTVTEAVTPVKPRAARRRRATKTAAVEAGQ